MKYFIALAIGLMIGAGGAGAVLYYNPLTGSRASTASFDWTLAYDFPSSGTLGLTHDGQLHLPHIPASIAPLWEASIKGTVLSVLRLDDEDGAPQALASRVSVPSPATDFLLRGAIVGDNWLVTVPGQGSFFVFADNNLWPLLKESFIPVVYLGRPWQGPKSYSITVGPGLINTGRVYGVNGRFGGARGMAREAYALERIDAARGIEALHGALELEFDPADQDVEAQ